MCEWGACPILVPLETHQKDYFSLVIKLLSVCCCNCSCSGHVDPSVFYPPPLPDCAHAASPQPLLLKELQIKCLFWLLLPLCQSHLGSCCCALGLVRPFPLALGAFHCTSCSLRCLDVSWLMLKPLLGCGWKMHKTICEFPVEKTALTCGSWDSAGFLLPGRKSGTS